METMDFNKPSEEFLRGINIDTLLPQKQPFVMIGALVEYSSQEIVTETKIEEKNIFVENGLFSSSGLIENIAQTCAARLGFYNIYISQSNIIEIGYIGSVKNLEIKRLPKVNSIITTKINIIEDIFGMTMAEATIECGDEIIAKGEIKIALAANGTKNN